MGKQISEFDGTGSGDLRSGGDTGSGIDPASLTAVGTGTGAGADNGTGSGPDDDSFERDEHGNVKRNRDGSPRRKRGRKSGGNSGAGFTASNPRKTASKDDLKRSVDALANMLAIAHMGIAGLTNIPEIALEQDDATLLASATVPVLEQFDFTPDPRFVAVFGMFAAMGKVYGPKAFLYRARKEAEKEARMKRVNPDFQPS